MERTLAIIQGCYFFLTGVWPLFSIGTFMKVTGPKTDLWLVKTVGVLIAVIGATLFMAGWNDQVTPSMALLAVGSAAGLGVVDIYYPSRKVISPIYYADAVVEAVLVLCWLGIYVFDAAG